MRTLALLLFLLPWAGWAQPIEVARLALDLEPKEQRILYYGFAPGDAVDLLVAERDSDRFGGVQVLEYPGTLRFSETDARRVALHWTSPRRQIYQIVLSGHPRRRRSIHLVLTRTSASEATAPFNTTVYFRHRIDSSAAGELERTTEQVADTGVTLLADRTLRLGGRYTSRPANRSAVVPLRLPSHTLSWSLYLGVGEEGARAYREGKDRFIGAAAGAASSIPGYGMLAALALHGVNYIQKSLVKEDPVSYRLFLKEDDALAAAEGSPTPAKPLREGQAAVEALAFQAPKSGTVYLVLQSTTLLEPQDVLVRAEAVTARIRTTSTLKRRVVGKSVEEPYLKEGP